tara:strand:+ start:249 stop:914 length:666 start_codon:yes stop_codon:yes gene_type:complete
MATVKNRAQRRLEARKRSKEARQKQNTIRNSQSLVEILQDVIRRRQIGAENIKSAQWFQQQIRSMRRPLTIRLDDTSMTADEFVGNTNLIRSRKIDEAKLTLFRYDAKHKKKLPYFDRFPMSMIIHAETDRFWGLNFHYLPYSFRARLLDAIRYGAKINWNSIKRNKYVKPCIKQYLTSHVQGTSAMTIEGIEQLKFAVLLPIEKFNTSTDKVFQDSQRML